MQLIINGQQRTFDSPLTIDHLLLQLQLSPERVVIELNNEILTAEAHTTPLNEGDTLEIIQFVGGG